MNDPWMVWRMRPARTLRFLALLQGHSELDGWTPVDRSGLRRKAMIPGLCFAPVSLRKLTMREVARRGFGEIYPLFINDSLVLLDEADLDGLRKSEEIANTTPDLQADEADRLEVGMKVRILHYCFGNLSGIIKRLDKDFAYLEVSGMPGRMVIARYMLKILLQEAPESSIS